MNLNKGSVPKFASFKPPKPAEPEASDQDQHKKHKRRRSSTPEKRSRSRQASTQRDRDVQDEDRISRRKRDDRHDGSKYERPHRHREHGHKVIHGSRSSDPRAGDIKPRENGQERSTHAPTQESQTTEYFVDRKGDEGNLRYGSIERSKVPIYRSYLRTRILGDNGRGDGPTHTSPRPLSDIGQDVMRSLRGEGRRVKSEPKVLGKVPDAHIENEEEHELDFLPLRQTRKRKRGSSMPENEAEAKSAGLSILEVSSEEESDGFDESEDGDVPDSGNKTTSTVSQVQVRNSELQRKLKEQPQNPLCWWDYINFQEQWVREGLSTGTQGRNKKDHRTAAEIKMSVFKDACDAIPDEDPAKEGLLLGMLDTVGLFSSPEEMTKVFEDIVQEHGHFTKVWLSYINFYLKSGGNLRFETGRDLFQNCLKNTADQRVGITPLDDDQAARKLHVFLRLTALLTESGYVELAIALWQAILEIVFPDPNNAIKWRREDTLATVLEKLEEFWGGEEPRIGDMSVNAPVTASKTHEESEYEVADKPTSVRDTKCSLWATKELHYAQNHCLPGKSTDESDIDDPFHVVFFADMEPFLKFDPRDMPTRVILNAFLCFCNMPFLPGPCSRETMHWLSDALLGVSSIFPRDDLAEISRNGSRDPDTKDPNFQEPTTSKILRSLHHYNLSTDTLFALPTQPFSSFATASPFRVIPCESIAHVLKRAVDAAPDDNDFAEYYLAFLGHFFPPQRSRRAAKSLLKSRSSNLRLYNAYALLESRNSPNKDSNAADHIFRTALTLSTESPSRRSDTLLLWRCWAREALNHGEWNNALRRIIGASWAVSGTSTGTSHGDTVIDDDVLLQAERRLKQALPSALASSDFTYAAQIAECLVLLFYLSPNSSTPTIPTAHSLIYALTTVQTLSTHFPTATSDAHAAHAVSTLQQSVALLIHIHVLVHNLPHTPPSTRRFLQTAAIQHPHNSAYTEVLLATALSGLPLEDTLRLPLAADAGANDESETLQQSAPRLQHTVRRYFSADENQRTTVHAVRAAFDRAEAEQRQAHAQGQGQSVGGTSMGLHTARLWFEWEAARRDRSASAGAGVGDGEVLMSRACTDVWARGWYGNLGWMKEWALFGLVRGLPTQEEQGAKKDGDKDGKKKKKKKKFRSEKEEGTQETQEEEMKTIYEGIVDRGLRIWKDVEE
ncbi:MAG: hypothetical protein M1831_001106 [Alyxoria varia]|nr:MAG: hypothetical protein M1831_001106 [Alyxoria varia]